MSASLQKENATPNMGELKKPAPTTLSSTTMVQVAHRGHQRSRSTPRRTRPSFPLFFVFPAVYFEQTVFVGEWGFHTTVLAQVSTKVLCCHLELVFFENDALLLLFA